MDMKNSSYSPTCIFLHIYIYIFIYIYIHIYILTYVSSMYQIYLSYCISVMKCLRIYRQILYICDKLFLTKICGSCFPRTHMLFKAHVQSTHVSFKILLVQSNKERLIVTVFFTNVLYQPVVTVYCIILA